MVLQAGGLEWTSDASPCLRLTQAVRTTRDEGGSGISGFGFVLGSQLHRKRGDEF